LVRKASSANAGVRKRRAIRSIKRFDHDRLRKRGVKRPGGYLAKGPNPSLSSSFSSSSSSSKDLVRSEDEDKDEDEEEDEEESRAWNFKSSKHGRLALRCGAGQRR
jgi:hypothetical protein